MTKPTFASVTKVACTCGYLQRMAKDPAIPIEFDQRINEFHFTFPDPRGDGSAAILLIYHCQVYGGALPESKHDCLSAANRR
jgi:hypothetical protein